MTYGNENFTEDKQIAEEVFRIHFSSCRNMKDDMVQDALIRLWEKRSEYKGTSAYKTFATKTIKNAMLNYIRKERNSLKYDVSIFEQVNQDQTYMDTLPDLLLDFEHLKLIRSMEKYRYELVRGCVARAIKLFSIDERKIIRLYILGNTYRAIEEKVGFSKSYVGNLVNKFKSEVAKELTVWGVREDFQKWI